MFTRFSLRDYNFKLLITVIIAMICGVVMINSADSSFTPKQTIGIGLGVIIMIFVSLLNYDFVCRFYRVFFIINAVILLSVIFFGVEVNYAKRWIMIGGSGGIQFQPSEFSKILMILFTATFLDKLKEDNKINTLKGLCLFVLLIGLSLALIAVALRMCASFFFFRPVVFPQLLQLPHFAKIPVHGYAPRSALQFLPMNMLLQAFGRSGQTVPFPAALM